MDKSDMFWLKLKEEQNMKFFIMMMLFLIFMAVPPVVRAEPKVMTSDNLNGYICASALPGTEWGDKKYFKAADLKTATALATMEYNRARYPHLLFNLVVKCEVMD